MSNTESLSNPPVDPTIPRLNYSHLAELFSRDSVLIVVVFFVAATGYLFGEKIQIGGGFGWDGALYGAIAKDVYREAVELPVNAYRVQRILPSIVVHLGLRSLMLERSDANVIHGFGLLNIVCLTILAWCWCRISRSLALRLEGKWLGFYGLFFNFAVAKHAAYYPVLTDIPAMMIGGAMLCCYLESRRTPLLILASIGAFTWPTLLAEGVGLALFPRNERRDGQVEGLPWRLNVVVAAFSSYYLLVMLAWITQRAPGPIWSGVTPIRSVIGLSAIISATYLFLVMVRILDSKRLFQRSEYLRAVCSVNGMLVLGVALVVKGSQFFWATKPSTLSPYTYLLLIGIWSVAKPAVFLLAQVVYYGPLMILAIFLWKPTVQLIHQHGLGLTLVLIFGFFNGLDSESRHIINFVPLFIPFVVKATESLRWNRGQNVFVALVCLVFSKCWFKINVGPMTGNAFHWPDQRYMMNVGPYMNNEMYLLQGGIALLTAMAMYWVCIRTAARF